MSSSDSSFNFIDLFAGAGGLSCGLEMAGHTCLLGVDHDQHAMNTFARNHHKASTYCGDIRLLSESKLKELTKNKKVHMVVGGPPCQGFSTVGLGNPKDLRNHLFLEFCRIVKLTGPHFLIMENVTGLLAKKNEKTLRAIFGQLEKLGYHINVQVMAAEKYGVPERRRRTVIIGQRNPGLPSFPAPSHDVAHSTTGSYIPPVSVGEALKNLAAESGEFFNHDIKSAAVKCPLDEKRLKRIPEGRGIRYESDEKAFLPPKLRLGIDWKKLPENRFRQMKYYRLSGLGPSPTIMTHRHTYFHPTECRYLTQREAAKLQSFPNDFIFTGPLSAQWRQIGNAVPPLLGKALGVHLLRVYKTAKKNKSEKRSEKELLLSIQDMRKSAFVYQERAKKKKAADSDEETKRSSRKK